MHVRGVASVSGSSIRTNETITDTYDGPAQLLLPTGREITVRAWFATRYENGFISWSGSMSAERSAGSLGAAMNSFNDHLRMRLPDGREAELFMTLHRPGQRSARDRSRQAAVRHDAHRRGRSVT